MTDPNESPLPTLPEEAAAPPLQVTPPAERIRSERAVRLAAALRANLKRRKHPTSAPRDDRH